WESNNIPGTPMVIGNWLPDDIKDGVQRAMSEYDAISAADSGFCADDSQQRAAPETWGPDYQGSSACLWGGTGAFAFEEANDADYDVIREICETTQAEVCRDDS